MIEDSTGWPTQPHSGAASTVVIAIDGPSGTGKSTVSRGLATRLGLRYLDTGAMYRAVTWAVLDAGVDPADSEAVCAVAERIELSVGTDPSAPHISVDGIALDQEIRGEAVTSAVSAVSAVAQVRERLVAVQRGVIGAGAIVVEGRDIGTVVVPNAPVKVFLTASARVRAQRRSDQDGLAAAEQARTEQSLTRRDQLDSSRAVAPLKAAEDAIEVDSTDLGIDEVLDRLVELATQAQR